MWSERNSLKISAPLSLALLKTNQIIRTVFFTQIHFAGSLDSAFKQRESRQIFCSFQLKSLQPMCDMLSKKNYNINLMKNRHLKSSENQQRSIKIEK
jgi:hypothetical protein